MLNEKKSDLKKDLHKNEFMALNLIEVWKFHIKEDEEEPCLSTDIINYLQRRKRKDEDDIYTKYGQPYDVTSINAEYICGLFWFVVDTVETRDQMGHGCSILSEAACGTISLFVCSKSIVILIPKGLFLTTQGPLYLSPCNP